jgi:hypothetical protein
MTPICSLELRLSPRSSRNTEYTLRARRWLRSRRKRGKERKRKGKEKKRKGKGKEKKRKGKQKGKKRKTKEKEKEKKREKRERKGSLYRVTLVYVNCTACKLEIRFIHRSINTYSVGEDEIKKYTSRLTAVIIVERWNHRLF